MPAKPLCDTDWGLNGTLLSLAVAGAENGVPDLGIGELPIHGSCLKNARTQVDLRLKSTSTYLHCTSNAVDYEAFFWLYFGLML